MALALADLRPAPPLAAACPAAARALPRSAAAPAAPTRPRWASTSARPYCATGSAFELSAWRAAATTTLAPGADVERLGRAIRHLLLAVLVDRAATPTTSPTSCAPSSPTPTPPPRPDPQYQVMRGPSHGSL